MIAPRPRPTVLVYATGGTIGMHDTGGGLLPDPGFPSALESLVAGICAPLGAEFRINHQNPAIDSANATAETAPRLAAAVRARVRTVHPRGVVILHGTDTLAHTAARLAFDLDGLGVPVILTGSQLPAAASNSDAPENLRLAIRTALRAGRRSPVTIAFGGQLLPAVRATKYQTDEAGAFRAERPLVPDPEGTAILADRRPTDAGRPPAAARSLAVRFVPGITAEDLRAAVGASPDAVVLECYGSGDAPMSTPGIADALREISARMPVLAISQCATGGVDFTRYAVGRKLEACGAIDGGDLTLESAIAKLGYLLDRGITGGELRTLLRRNLVGERTPA